MKKIPFDKIKAYITSHKKISALVLLAVILAIIFIVKLFSSSTVEASYLTTIAKQGTITSTVSGTGQVSTQNALAINPQSSGALTSIRKKVGDTVKQGEILFSIDATEAEKQLRDARLSLASAELSYKSFLASSEDSLNNQSLAVKQAYRTLLNSNLAAVPKSDNNSPVPTLSGNYTLDKEGSITITTYASDGGISFMTEGLVNETGLASSITAQPLGNSGIYTLFPAQLSAGLSWTINLPNKSGSSYLSNLNNYEQAVRDQEEASEQGGVTDLNLQAKKISLEQAQNSYADAQSNLAKYYVRAPFAGTIANIPVSLGQSVSSGTTLGTLVTEQQIATIALNEVDASKVAVDQTSTMTFDAIEDLSIPGKVIEVEQIGTVSQGVVTYNVKIAFDINDPRIKTGMSTSVTIATEVRENVIVVPSSAVKSKGKRSYVLVATSRTDNQPVEKIVTVGISDDDNTEIISGLDAGTLVVTKTITAGTAPAAATQTPSILNTVGGSRATGAAGAAPRNFTR